MSSMNFNASNVGLHYDSDGEEHEASLYFDAPQPKPKPKPQPKPTDMGERTSSSGALEMLMSEQPIPKSPGRNGARRARPSLQESSKSPSSWDKLKKRMKSPKRLSSPRRGGSPKRFSSPSRARALDPGEGGLVTSTSDHALVSRRRNTVGSMSITMSGGTRMRRSANMSNTAHGGANSRFDMSDESPKQSQPRARLRVRRKKLSVDSSGDDGASVVSSKSLPVPKSPGKKKSAAKVVADDSQSIQTEKPRNRLRRKGNRTSEISSFTPTPSSKPMVELEDLGRFSDSHIQNGRIKTKKKKKRRSSTDSPATKKSSSDDNMSFVSAELPPTLPFDDDDDDGATVTSAKTSASAKKKKKKRLSAKKSVGSPGRMKRANKVDVSAFESDITALQEEVLRLKESKISGDSETSKHMQELRRKAFDARLELQKAQLENRQVRSDLQSKAAALNEAEVDIETMEKKIKDKDSEIARLREQLKLAESNASGEAPPPPPSPPPIAQMKSPRANQAIIDRYETIIDRKDTKLANLERELRRLRKSGGGMLQMEQEEMQETIEELQRALKESQAKTIAISKKFSEQRGETSELEQEIEHWKSIAHGKEDEIAEVRSELKYWIAKYEDVVGASDAAKAQLTAPNGLNRSPSLVELSKLNSSLNSLEYFDIDQQPEGETPEEQKPEERKLGGLWSRMREKQQE